jgi:hypothetical protein
VTIAAYVLNKSPKKNLGYLTPEEAFTGKKSYVGHLRVFGGPCYTHILVENRKKLDDRSEILVVLKNFLILSLRRLL